MPKFGTKSAFLGYFWARIVKNYCHILNQHLKLIKNESLSHTVNFDIGSAFSKGSGSTFSEGPDPSPRPLYKVCRRTYVQSIPKKTVFGTSSKTSYPESSQ